MRTLSTVCEFYARIASYAADEDFIHHAVIKRFWHGILGSRFNLKSFISRYVALALLIQNCNNDLELFCDNKSDEANFFEFFRDNPGVLGDSREEFWQDV